MPRPTSRFGKKKDGKKRERGNNLFKRKKFCRFTAEGVKEIDFKDVEILKDFIQDNGKIMPARITGTKARYQRQLGIAIKRARFRLHGRVAQHALECRDSGRRVAEVAALGKAHVERQPVGEWHALSRGRRSVRLSLPEASRARLPLVPRPRAGDRARRGRLDHPGRRGRRGHPGRRRGTFAASPRASSATAQ